MDSTQHNCHRCGSSLAELQLFCSQCGAPQLVLGEEATGRLGEQQTSTAAVPNSASTAPLGVRGIRWRVVLRLAMIVALAAGTCSGLGGYLPFFGFFSTILILLAPTLCLSFYQRSVPDLPMGAGVGARIGLVLGIALSMVISLVDTGSELVERYLLHRGAQMDQALADSLNLAMQHMPATANPDAALLVQHWFAFFQTPDGRAAGSLLSSLLAGLVLTIYCLLFGTLLGWLRPTRLRRPQA